MNTLPLLTPGYTGRSEMPSVKKSRLTAAFSPLFTLLVLLLLAGCTPSGERSEGVRLILASDLLEPTTTFEIRFDEPVVDDAQVGRAVEKSPLVITPVLPGKFTWLSQRSGVFTPSEPPVLGQRYRLDLRSGLKRTYGSRLRARLCRWVRTPDFALERYSPRQFNTNNAPSEPQLFLQFNAEVNPVTATRYCEFRSADGQRIPAVVVPAPQAGWWSYYDFDFSRGQTWKDRFYAHYTNAVVPLALAPTVEPITELPLKPGTPAKEPAPPVIPNMLIVSPARPLPVGKAWQLVVAAGLPTREGQPRLTQATRILLGDVTAFEIEDIRARNGLESGRRIELTFTKSLASEVNTNNLTHWISVDPAPPDLRVTLRRQAVELRGGFQLEQRYQVRLQAGLPAVSGFKLGTNGVRELVFTPLPPRLYFPAFSTEQLSGGNRQFELLTVNVPEVRLRAKILDANTLVHALRGYRSYFQNETGRAGEYYKEVDFNIVAGRTIYFTNFPAHATTDQSVKTVLSWDDILGGRKHGAVFLVAEMASAASSAGPGLAEPESEPIRAQLGTQTLVQLTDLGLYWKRSEAGLWVSVFSYGTGQPVAGVKLRLLDNDSVLLEDRTTDAQGDVQFSPQPEALWLMAEKESDLHAIRLAGNWEYQLPVDNAFPRAWPWSPPNTQTLMLFSDRPVYRPGETLHLKALLREWNNDGLTIPSGVRATLKCFDARERNFAETNLEFSALGSAAISLSLPENVRGGYRAELSLVSNQVESLYFQVQEFKPNLFEIELRAPAAWAADDPVAVPVAARYYLGSAVNQASLKWSLVAQDSGFAPAGYEDFVFCTQVEPQLGRDSTLITLNGETNFTSQPPLVLQPEIPMNPTAPQPRSIDLLVEMTDASQQTISQRTRFIRHSTEFYLGLRKFPGVVHGNRPLPVHLVAVRPEGEPYSPPVQATLRLQKIEWRTVRWEGAGKVPAYRSEPEYVEVTQQTVSTGALIKEGSKWGLSPEARPSTVLTPASAGLYLLEAMAKDAGGREVVTAMTFFVTSVEALAWNYRNEVQIDLTPDQTNYLAGQVATILVKTPYSGMALVTLERDRILRSFTTNLTGNAPSLQVPLQDTDAPNVFVSVFLARGHLNSPHLVKQPEYRIGYCLLEVDRPDSRLVIDLDPGALSYRPGQTVNIQAAVKDQLGRPATGAEVTLFAVDEGILSLTDYSLPDPHPLFWAPRPLAVWSHSTLPALLPEDPGELRFQNKGYLIGGGGAAAQSRLRKNFLPCAYWNARLISDAQGKVRASFPAPDSLTRYRVIAVAHTASNQFGHGESLFQVNKPLMLEPALPRFANLGDRLVARALVHNLTDTAGTVEVTLDLDDCAMGMPPASLGKKLSQQIDLAAQTSRAVDFPVEFVTTGSAVWAWRSRFVKGPQDDFTDAVQSTLPVGHKAPLLAETWVRRCETSATNLLAEANPQLLEGQGTVTVRVANTRLAELGEAISHLLHYPYGCAEQTASSLLPWFVLHDFAPVLPSLRQSPAEADRAIKQGINRLLAMQVAGEGLAYWPGGREPLLWASAYGGLMLALAQQHGYVVPAANLDGLWRYLENALQNSVLLRDNTELSDRCLALYTLAVAGKPQPSYYETFYSKRELLSPESRALLALAIVQGPGPRELVENLLKRKETHPPQGDLWFGCPPRELAVQLLAWCRYSARNPKVDILAEELLHTRQQGHWITTQGNAWAVFALGAYVRQVESVRHDATGVVTWTDDRREFRLPEKPGVFETVFSLTSNRINQPLQLENSEPRVLFTTTKIEARSRVSQQPRQDRGFALHRHYALVTDDGAIREFKDARVGDRVLVSLRLEVRETAHYLAVDDPWPAILEPLNPNFKSQATRVGEVLGTDWVSDFREFRNDRALFFRDHLIPGTYVIRYLARVRAAGTATAPSAKVEEMYHPERLGLSESVELTSRARD